MTIADQFAQLMAGINLQSPPATPGFKLADNNPPVKSKTVYSVGEAVKGKESARNAKLGASSY